MLCGRIEMCEWLYRSDGRWTITQFLAETGRIGVDAVNFTQNVDGMINSSMVADTRGLDVDFPWKIVLMSCTTQCNHKQAP
jgi:hypothetical protein